VTLDLMYPNYSQPFFFKKKIQLYSITLNAYYTVTSTNTVHSLQRNWPVDLQTNKTV